MAAISGIARHRGFASLTYSKSQSRIVVTSAAAHGRIVKTVKKVTTYMVGTVKRQNTSSSERSWRKIAETRQSLFRKSAWSGYAHKMCAVDSNTKRLYSNEMSDRATHFTVFMIMNCPVEQQILAAYGSIFDSRRTFIDFIRKAHKNLGGVPLGHIHFLSWAIPAILSRPQCDEGALDNEPNLTSMKAESIGLNIQH